jgi:hypothetical protein
MPKRLHRSETFLQWTLRRFTVFDHIEIVGEARSHLYPIIFSLGRIPNFCLVSNNDPQLVVVKLTFKTSNAKAHPTLFKSFTVP